MGQPIVISMSDILLLAGAIVTISAAAKGGSTSNYKWIENVDSKGVSDVSQANMPPYLAVYVWKRIS